MSMRARERALRATRARCLPALIALVSSVVLFAGAASAGAARVTPAGHRAEISSSHVVFVVRTMATKIICGSNLSTRVPPAEAQAGFGIFMEQVAVPSFPVRSCSVSEGWIISQFPAYPAEMVPFMTWFARYPGRRPTIDFWAPSPVTLVLERVEMGPTCRMEFTRRLMEFDWVNAPAEREGEASTFSKGQKANVRLTPSAEEACIARSNAVTVTAGAIRGHWSVLDETDPRRSIRIAEP